MQPVISELDCIFWIRIIVSGRIKWDSCATRIRIVLVMTGNRVFEAFKFYKPVLRKCRIVIQINYLQFLIVSDLPDSARYLRQALTVLFLVGSPGIVLTVKQVYKIGPFHWRDQEDPGFPIDLSQMIHNDPERSINRSITRIPLIVLQRTNGSSLPPVVGTQEYGVHIRIRDVQGIKVRSNTTGGPTIISFVDHVHKG